MATQKFYLALDLKDDANLIAEYKELHENVWPEINNLELNMFEG